MQVVGGSNPLAPTSQIKGFREGGLFLFPARHCQSSQQKSQPTVTPLYYRVLVTLNGAHLERDGTSHALLPGMQVSAEIHPGARSAMENLLSPIQKVVHEAGRER